MIIDLYNTDEFIKVNKLQEVTNPMLFTRGGIPSPDGLVSTDIFGVSVKARKDTFAYINLSTYFLHPFIYKLLKRMDKRFESIVHGNERYIIKNGNLEENEDSGDTGLKFLYDNWEKINFQKNNSMMRGERIDLLRSYGKDVLFTKNWIVIPPFYRDVNLENAKRGILSHHPINDKYSKLIRLVSVIKNSNNFDFVMDSTKAKVQLLLVEIYDLLKERIAKKNGMIRKSLLGKSEDFGIRSVITAPTFHANKYTDMEIQFGKTGIPLGHICAFFFPFIMHWTQNFFRREFERSGMKYPAKKKGELTFVQLADPEIYYNEEYLKKRIDNYVSSPTTRFDPVEVPVKNKEDETLNLKLRFTGKEYIKGSTEQEFPQIDRYMTWTDIFYMAAMDIAADKHAYITRYPALDYFNSFPTQVVPITTKETMEVYINGKVYHKYPKIDITKSKKEVALSFVDTVTMSNLMLKGLDGDYDGDQVTEKSMFTQEANEECEKIIHSKMFILDGYGKNTRKISHEAIQAFYNMTKF